ncbi:MAG TPA: VC0807 family protein [Polyangiaceae bacterium]|jgi:intracellular septation protein A
MDEAAAKATKPSRAGVVRFVLESFGPLIVFVALEHAVSLLAAIISSIVTGAILVGLQISRDKKISPFTAYVAASVAVFGVLDLKYQTGFFVKIEPALGNVVTGLFFLGTVAVGRPLIVELAQKQSPEPFTERRIRYLRTLTIVWGIFFFMRASAYVWMAYHLSIDQALAVRSVAGPVSFGVLIIGEMGVRRLVRRKRALA